MTTEIYTFNTAGYIVGTSFDIRALSHDGEPWFVAKDILDALEYPRGSQGYQLRQLGSDEKDALKIKATVRPMVCISESGLYKLIMRSDKPQARRFQDWVTKIVLPAIRKDGEPAGRGYFLHASGAMSHPHPWKLDLP